MNVTSRNTYANTRVNYQEYFIVINNIVFSFVVEISEQIQHYSSKRHNYIDSVLIVFKNVISDVYNVFLKYKEYRKYDFFYTQTCVYELILLNYNRVTIQLHGDVIV